MTEQEAITVFEEILAIDYRDTIPKYYEAMELAVKDMKEVKKYRTIGTPEECRSAVEKQMEKKPKEYEDKFYGCPTCGNVLLHKWEKYPTKLMDKKNGLPYCLGCGQRILWEV